MDRRTLQRLQTLDTTLVCRKRALPRSLRRAGAGKRE